MKITYTLILCLVFTSIFAQEKYKLSLGANFIIDYRQDKISTTGLVNLVENTAITSAGKISGNFAGKNASAKRKPINGNKYWYKPAIVAANNKLSIHCAEQEFCFLTNPIDISKSSSIGFEIDFSGNGSLDHTNPADGKIWRDWIDINYYVDGQLANDKSSENTLEGFAINYSKQDIDVRNGKEFQIEICMRNTGHDEWYTIESIEIEKDQLWEIDLPDVDVVALKAIQSNLSFTGCGNRIAVENIETDLEIVEERPKNKIDNSPTLSVFPNPTTDYLELKNAHQYDLDSIVILAATGKLINITSTYPLNLSNIPAGTYFITVQEVESKELVSASFVIMNR